MQWDPGTQLVYRAFNEYFMGKPTIEEIVIKIIPDSNTLVSNVLSGAVDATLGVSLAQNSANTIRQQWAQTGGGEIKSFARGFRYIQFQLDPARTHQPALQDVRVRRAIVAGIDREALAEAITEGAGKMAEVILPVTDPLYPRAERVFAKYPFDPTRAAALLQEAGWTRGGDGLVNPAAQRFNLDMRDTSGRDSELEAGIIAANLSALGMQMSETIIPQSRVADVEYRVTFPGLNGTAVPIDIPASMNIAHGDQCATVERRYVGVNRGCWRNADYDRAYLMASTSLDVAEREAAIIDALRVVTEEVGIFGLAYTPESVAVRKGLIGPGIHYAAQVGTAWNVHTWRWE
jgi:peptide/nickel transport system substrate-binding protein